MDNFVKNLKCEYSEKITALLNKKTSFAISGITNCAKLIILSQLLLKNKKKIIFVVETEQKALKFQNDFKNFFNKETDIFPYQDGSIYDTNTKNLYKYSKQIKILENQNDIIIVPQKSLFEKFPDKQFFKENNINIKINDEIDTKELAEKLVHLGYKRKTLVADIGEFSIRGDVIDIFPLNENPYRIELWGDCVTDIRIFDNSTQRSISKTDEAIVQPIYKFVLNKDEDYFEGIEYYEVEYNNDLATLPRLINKDYIFVFDDYTQFKSRYEQIDENLEKQYEENIKSEITEPLKIKKHHSIFE